MFCQREVHFLVDEGKEGSNTAVNWSSLAFQGIALFKWHFAGGPMMIQHKTLNARLEDLLFFRGSGPVLLRNPIFL